MQWQVYETDENGNVIVGRVWQIFNTEEEADAQVARETLARQEEKNDPSYQPPTVN